MNDTQTKTLTAEDLTKGDIIRDTDGHGRENNIKYAPDLSDELYVDTWIGDGWMLTPLVENGKVSTGNAFTVSYDEITERLESGRYEPVDVEYHRSLDLSDLNISEEDDVYVRFGDIPEDERSTNHVDGSKEKGVSAYSAKILGTHDDRDAPAEFVPRGNKLQQILLLRKRDTYLITGEEVGRGEDGEPVLSDVEVITELKHDGEGFVPK